MTTLYSYITAISDYTVSILPTLLISSTTRNASPETYSTALWYLPLHCYKWKKKVIFI